MNSLAKRFTWWDWGIEGNHVWSLVIVVIFMGLAGARRWVGDVLNSSFGWQVTKGGQFYGGNFETLGQVFTGQVFSKPLKDTSFHYINCFTCFASIDV